MYGHLAIGTIQELALQCAVFDALLLLASAAHKLVGWRDSRRAVRQFAGVPESLASAVLAVVVAVEICAAALLLAPAHRAVGGAAAVGVWALYLGFIARAFMLGRRDVDCGCSFGAHRAPLRTFHLVRNAVLVLTALVVSLEAPVNGAVAGSQLLAGCALLALYGALDQVMALQPLRSGETG